MKTLQINSNNGYLSMPDLPHNCIFNKVITGCGGTTIALHNNENYIIAVPTTELIVNKTKRDGAGLSKVTILDKEVEIFGVFGTYREIESKLKKYLKRGGLKKVICTYDKLERITQLIDASEYRLLIDEYQNLLRAYSFRDKAIDGVLANFRKYKSFCFLSATPITADFKPSALEGIDEIEAVWENTESIKVELVKTNKPYLIASKFIEEYKTKGYFEYDGIKSTEAYFFINSVDDILKIVHHCNLSANEVRIICANNAVNRRKVENLKTEDGTTFTIKSSVDSAKMFNFITSKSFEGADFFSEAGFSFVVSSVSNRNTLVSIDTDIPQIVGRIRNKNNPFRNKLIHIFSTSHKDLLVPYEEIKNKILKELEQTKTAVSELNKVSADTRKVLAKTSLNNAYIYEDSDGFFYLNDLLIKLELYNRKIYDKVYNGGLQLAYRGEDIEVNNEINAYMKNTVIVPKANKVGKISFKEAFMKYVDIMDNKYNMESVEDLIKEQPLIVDAYKKLGVDTVRRLRYTKTAVEKELLKNTNTLNVDTKITKLLLTYMKLNEFYSKKEIKSILGKVYNELGVTDTPKATSISKWFTVKESSRSRVEGYLLLKTNLIFKHYE